MIATVPFNLVAALALGVGFALAAGAQLRAGRSPWGREARAVASFAILIYAPAALYLFVLHRDWSLMYLVEGGEVSAAWAPLVVAAETGLLLGGYRAGCWLVVHRGDRKTLRALAAVVFVLVIMLLTSQDRLVRDGDWAAWKRGDAPSIVDTKLAWALVVGQLGVAAAGFFALQTVRRERHRKSYPTPPAARRVPR